MTKSLRSIHKYLSLAVFIPIIIISLSGSILVYKYEVDNILMPKVTKVQIKKKQLSYEKLKKIVNQSQPRHEIVGWLIPTKKDQAHRVYLIKHHTKIWESLYLNPYTGELLDVLKNHDSYFSDIIVELHANFLLEKKGLYLLLLVGIFYCFIAISGIIIYKNFWKNFFILRFNKNLLVYFKDFHKMIGILSSPLILIIAIIGSYWSINSILKKEIPYHVKENLYNKNLSLDTLHQEAKNSIKDFKLTYISFPYKGKKQLSYYGEIKSQNIIHNQYSSSIIFDKHTGNIIRVSNVNDLSIYHKFLGSLRKLHFGYYNEGTKLFWFFLGLSPLLLSITGITLMYKKRKK
ncbi:MAG: PepSY domain-containing protein [Campylobacteraceae bacterium]|nr:PepSY domain-containing protein [Campylobacteraceae bacterium]